MHSEEEEELEEFGVGPLITQVAWVVKQIGGGSAPGVDEILPELLKALDSVRLLWFICLCNFAWTSGTLPMKRQFQQL